jgi:hypothetical protein
LKAATRIISEWTDYDQEIKTLMIQWEDEGKPIVQLPVATIPASVNNDDATHSISKHGSTEL